MTRNEKTKSIRAAYKKLGWNNRQISVRAAGVTHSDSISVVIKDLSIGIAAVRNVAMRHEKIDRCEITGDILLGGNTYVQVSYDRCAIASRVGDLDRLIEFKLRGKEQGTVITLVDGWTIWEVSQDRWSAHPTLLDIGTPAVSCYDRRFCAKQIVILRLDEAGKSGGIAA